MQVPELANQVFSLLQGPRRSGQFEPTQWLLATSLRPTLGERLSRLLRYRRIGSGTNQSRLCSSLPLCGSKPVHKLNSWAYGSDRDKARVLSLAPPRVSPEQPSPKPSRNSSPRSMNRFLFLPRIHSEPPRNPSSCAATLIRDWPPGPVFGKDRKSTRLNSS